MATCQVWVLGAGCCDQDANCTALLCHCPCSTVPAFELMHKKRVSISSTTPKLGEAGRSKDEFMHAATCLVWVAIHTATRQVWVDDAASCLEWLCYTRGNRSGMGGVTNCRLYSACLLLSTGLVAPSRAVLRPHLYAPEHVSYCLCCNPRAALRPHLYAQGMSVAAFAVTREPRYVPRLLCFTSML